MADKAIQEQVIEKMLKEILACDGQEKRGCLIHDYAKFVDAATQAKDHCLVDR